MLNQEQNEKYREPMMKYVALQTKADKTDEINNVDDIKLELNQMNNVAYNLYLGAELKPVKPLSGWKIWQRYTKDNTKYNLLMLSRERMDR